MTQGKCSLKTQSIKKKNFFKEIEVCGAVRPIIKNIKIEKIS